MNTARFLSIATLAAFASFGAQAGIDNSNAGDLYGQGFDTMSQTSQSTVSRAEVRSEGAAALPHQMNNAVVTIQPTSNVSRSTIRAEAVMAVHNNQLATGNQS